MKKPAVIRFIQYYFLDASLSGSIMLSVIFYHSHDHALTRSNAVDPRYYYDRAARTMLLPCDHYTLTTLGQKIPHITQCFSSQSDDVRNWIRYLY